MWNEHRRRFGYVLVSELPYQAGLLLEDVGAERTLDLMLVDEYQDLNEADIKLIRRTAESGVSVIAIGDDDQSIYSFRMAAPEGIRRFLTEFGADRVRNTPIIESGAIGAALGLALDGFLPVVELQFGDFVSCGFNQVVNNLAKTHYRWGAPVPVVLRLPIGGGTGAGPFHSQDVEAWFCHVAGLKVVAPSNPADAKALLLAALEDGNPVLYCEHKAMYRSVTGPVAEDDRPIEALGPARVVRPGRDATVVTWSIGVPWALTAAEALSDEGIEVEVVDLRTLLPWDVDTVLASVERTGRCLVLHEAPITGGFGGEVAATVADRAFAHLDAPVRRLGALDTPVPHAKALEALHSPRDRLLPTLRALLAY